MTGDEAKANFDKAEALRKAGKLDEARAVDLMPSDRVVLENHIKRDAERSKP